MQGNGQQIITLSDNCKPAEVPIHEIGHAVGLWHEQSRADRDKYIKILKENIDPDKLYNFDQHVTDGDDIGPYDYCSIMHYRADAFSKNGQPTIQVLNRLAPCAQNIGKASTLSDDDKDAVHRMYENRPLTVARLSDGRLALYLYSPDFGSVFYSEQKKTNDSNSWTKWVQEYSDFPSGTWPAIVTSDAGVFVIWISYANDAWWISYRPPDGPPNTISGGNFSEAPGDPVAALNHSNEGVEVFWVSNSEKRELYHIVLPNLTTP
jgi:hypothetical protein